MRRRPLHRECFDFVFGQHDRKTLWALGADEIVYPARIEIKHVTIQKDERIERLVLGGRTDVLVSARCERNCPISTSPISRGWRLLWKKINRLIQ